MSNSNQSIYTEPKGPCSSVVRTYVVDTAGSREMKDVLLNFDSTLVYPGSTQGFNGVELDLFTGDDVFKGGMSIQIYRDHAQDLIEKIQEALDAIPTEGDAEDMAVAGESPNVDPVPVSKAGSNVQINTV